MRTEMESLTPETRAALRAAVESGVQTLCRNCLQGVQKVTYGTNEVWVHGPGGWEGLRCPRRLTFAEPFQFASLLDALDDALGPEDIERRQPGG